MALYGALSFKMVGFIIRTSFTAIKQKRVVDLDI